MGQTGFFATGVEYAMHGYGYNLASTRVICAYGVGIGHGGHIGGGNGRLTMPDSAMIQDTIQAITDLLELPRNWDSYGAPRIAPQNIREALWFTKNIMRPDAQAPQVVPTVRGGVQLEWHTDGVNVEIEFQEDEPDGLAGG